MKSVTFLRLMAAGLAMCLGLFVQAANANTTSTLVFSNNVTSYDAVFGNNSVTGTFLDTYNFHIPTGAGTSGGAIVISSYGTLGWETIFTGFFELMDTTTNALVGSGTVPSVISSFTFVAPSLTDAYALLVHGKPLASGPGSGGYAGAVSISPASAVPEPETYAMMLAGLGLLLFTARRRTSNGNQSFA